MDTKYPTKTLLGFVLFFAGILAGTTFFAGLSWAQMESAFYGFPQLSNEYFDGLTCPAIMTSQEIGTIRAKVKNESDHKTETVLRAEISTPFVAQSERTKIALNPGESQTATWTVSVENIDLKRFIFVRVYRYPAYKMPLAEAGCGILVFNLPWFSGQALFWLWMGTGICLPLAGFWLLKDYRKNEAGRAKISNALLVQYVIMLAGIAAGIQWAWLPGFLALVLIILLGLAMIYLAFNRN